MPTDCTKTPFYTLTIRNMATMRSFEVISDKLNVQWIRISANFAQDGLVGYRLSWLRHFAIFLSLSRWMLGENVEIAHDPSIQILIFSRSIITLSSLSALYNQNYW